jgi:hypothetical protein
MSVDMSKVTWKDGKLNIPVAGCEIKLEVIPIIKLAPELVKGELYFYANVTLGGTAISEDNKEDKTQEYLESILKKEPIMPTHWKYDDILVGFVYGTKEDPNNHTWMLTPRVKGISGEMLFADLTCDIECPMATISWEAQGNWHGRFCIVKEEIKSFKRKNSGNLTIVGKCGGYPDGKKDYPEDTKIISIRYNIFKNKWYLGFLDKDDKFMGDRELDDLITDIKMYGKVDKDHKKPKVTQYIKVEDIASCKIISNVAIIYGK